MNEPLEKTVRACMRLGDIPGVVVGTVDRSGTRSVGGFGEANVESGTAPDEHSRFSIQSCTKSFTAAAVAVLVDQGIVEWDRPIRQYVPGFRMHDPVASESVTFRDILAHRTGLPFGGHDWMRITSPLSRRELLERLPHLESNQPVREAFQYSNLMYVIAGALIECITGTSWEEFLRQRLLAPLGMTHTGFGAFVGDEPGDMADYSRVGDVRVRYSTLWEPELLERLSRSASAPCGGVISTVQDLCSWLQFQLAPERIAPVLASADVLRDIHAIQSPCPSPLRESEVADGGVALGWFVQTYRGRPLIAHWGGGFGPTVLSFMPGDGVGVCVHSNRAESSFHAINAIMLSAYDGLLGLEPVSWADRWATQMTAAPPEPLSRPAPDRTMTTDLGKLHSFTGRFEHPGYGVIEIRETAAGAHLDYHGLRFGLRAAGGDTVEMRLDSRVPPLLRNWWGTRQASALRMADGRVGSVAIPFEPAVQDIVFVRCPCLDRRSEPSRRQAP